MVGEHGTVSELSKMLNLQSKKAKLFLAKKPYESSAEPFCFKALSDGSGLKKKLNFRSTSQLIESDAVLVPFDLWYWHKNQKYISYLKSLADKRKLIVLNTSDFIPKIKKIENVIYLRPFLNPGEKSPNSIIIPYEIDSVTTARSINPDFYISFMGYFPKIISRRLIYALKNSFWHPIQGNGSIVRKLMARKLKKTNLPLSIVARNSYSGWKRDKSIDNINRRLEFLNSIRDSKYIICPRGDGNQSIRFYETLSAGRVPILIDTSIKLPLEVHLDYSKFIIRVKIQDSVKVWTKTILEFESLHNGPHFKNFSQEICSFYDENLSIYNFYKNLFKDFIV